ncbi:MAG TPA: hypothetical protein VNR65_09060 [Geobacterales bacterium]|nr:hypothetical protein [Geobacterales bacterium]
MAAPEIGAIDQQARTPAARISANVIFWLVSLVMAHDRTDQDGKEAAGYGAFAAWAHYDARRGRGCVRTVVGILWGAARLR